MRSSGECLVLVVSVLGAKQAGRVYSWVDDWLVSDGFVGYDTLG